VARSLRVRSVQARFSALSQTIRPRIHRYPTRMV